MSGLRKALRPPWVFVVLAVAALSAGIWFLRREPARESLPLDRFEAELVSGQVATADLGDRDGRITGRLADGTRYRTTFPSEYADELVTKVLAADVELEVDNQRPSLWSGLLVSLLPTVLVIGVLAWLLTAAQGGRGVMSFGRAKDRRVKAEGLTVTFADVAGSDEAVEELGDLKAFLQDPGRFRALGARVPTGVLLYGPPGTGKTLLARAVAGEAKVPFFSISGSDFVEMFVGVGASRVRDLFKQAKEQAPAIVFIDEIDAVGRHRGSGLGGGHDEREQTLNQLLVELDGFDVNGGVILIAGTNRPDVLDPALLRPGRFDRQIPVDPPDLAGRRAILAVHARDKVLDPGVDLDVLARRTPGFTGADLANVLNEAALLAARRGAARIERVDVDAAVERVMAGPERKRSLLSEGERRVVAYHEAGHALVGHVLDHTDPIHKVSIVARGRALGWTLALPEEDRVVRTRSHLRDQLAMLLGGRAAEEVAFGEPSTGAQDDIERVTRIARAMVTQWGMSDALGPQQLAGLEGDGTGALSEVLAARVDDEVRRLVDEAHRRAVAVLVGHRAVLDELAAALVAEETLEGADLDAVLGRAVDVPEAAG